MTAEFICFFPCLAFVFISMSGYFFDWLFEKLLTKKSDKEVNSDDRT